MAHAYDNNKATIVRGRSTSGRDIAITVPSGSTLLICAIAVDGLTARTVGAVTCGLSTPYNQYTFTQADQNRYYASTGETISELWYLLAPPSGSVTIHIPDANNVYFSADAASFTAGTGMDSKLRGANGTSGSSTNPTCPGITNCVAGDVAISTSGDGLADYSVATSSSGGQILYAVDDGAYGHSTQYRIATGSGTMTEGWTANSSTWGAIVAVFQEWPKDLNAGASNSVTQSGTTTDVPGVQVANQVTLSATASQSAKVTEVIGAAVMASGFTLQTDFYQVFNHISISDTAKATEVKTVSVETPITLNDSSSESAKVSEAVATAADTPATLSKNITESVAVNEAITSEVELLTGFTLETDFYQVFNHVSVSDNVKVTESVAASVTGATAYLEASGADNAAATELVFADIELLAGFTLKTDLWQVSEHINSAEVIEPVRVTESVTASLGVSLTLSTDYFDTLFGLTPNVSDRAKVTESKTAQINLSPTASQSAKVSEARAVSASTPVTLTVSKSEYAKVTEADTVSLPGAAGIYLLLQHSRFLSDVDRSPLTPTDDGALSTSTKGKIILATEMGLDGQDAIDASYKLQWRNVTDGGSFADVGSTGQVKWSTTTACGKTDGAAIRKNERQCTNLDAFMTYQNGLFNLGDNLLPDTGVYVTAADIYTEFEWAIDLSDSLDNKQYQFQVYNNTAGASAGICASLFNVQPLSATTSDAAKVSESVGNQIDLPATANQSVKLTENNAVNIPQTALTATANESARLSEDSSGYILLEPNAVDSPRLGEFITTEVEGELADLSLAVSESVKLTELLTVSAEVPAVLAPGVDESAAVVDSPGVDIPLIPSVFDAARTSETVASSVETPVDLTTSAENTVAITEELTASVADVAAEIAVSDHAKASEVSAVIVEAQITLAASKVESVSISEDIAVEAPGLGTTLEASIEDSVAAVDDLTASGEPVELNADVTEYSRLLEFQSTEMEGHIGDVYPPIYEQATTSESLSVDVSIQTVLELPLVDYATLVELAQIQVETLIANYESVAVNEELAATVSVPTDLDIQIEDRMTLHEASSFIAGTSTGPIAYRIIGRVKLP